MGQHLFLLLVLAVFIFIGLFFVSRRYARKDTRNQNASEKHPHRRQNHHNDLNNHDDRDTDTGSDSDGGDGD